MKWSGEAPFLIVKSTQHMEVPFCRIITNYFWDRGQSSGQEEMQRVAMASNRKPTGRPTPTSK